MSSASLATGLNLAELQKFRSVARKSFFDMKSVCVRERVYESEFERKT